MTRCGSLDDDVCIVAVVRGNERYIVMYDETTRVDALRVLGRWASNPELSFSWMNAAHASQKIRQGQSPHDVDG